jgi:hypothetical protein
MLWLLVCHQWMLWTLARMIDICNPRFCTYLQGIHIWHRYIAEVRSSLGLHDYA